MPTIGTRPTAVPHARVRTAGAAFALALALLTGLPACARPAEPSWSNVVRPELRFALRLTGPDTWVSHTDGGGIWGFVRVKVWGDGRVNVSWGSPQEQKERDGKLAPEDLAAFKARLADTAPRLMPPLDRPGVPDETRLRFGSDLEELAYMVFYKDAPQYPAVLELREAFLVIGDKVSGTSLPR